MSIIDDGKLDWIAILLQLLNIAEEAAGTQFPRFDSDGKMLLPESQSSKLALRMLDPHGVGNALFVAACKADPTLHAAVSVAALNCQDADKARLLDALKGV